MVNRSVIIAGAVAVVVIGAGWYFSSRANQASQGANQPAAGEQTELSNTNSSASNPAKTTGIKTTTNTLKAGQVYAEARDEYQYRFTFLQCHGTPGSLNVKAGSKIMLENGDDVSHKIALGSQVFTIGGHKFVIATAPSKAAGYYITCDGGGAAQLFVYP
jgi:hypothetical protein